jgi:hypothetical protein
MADPAEDAARSMAEAVAAWQAALTAEQRAKASFSFEDASERTDWAYFPREHKGLPLLEQDARQQKLAHVLIARSISLPAYAKVTTIMGLESVLNELEDRRGDALRDPGRYFLSVFGSPAESTWGWRFEGHHVCLNFTIVGGVLASPTPLFLGANPASVEHGEHAVVRPCGEEEDAARELLLSLDDEQRRTAVLFDTAPRDIVLTNLPRVPDAATPGDGAPGLLRPFFEAAPREQKEALRFELSRPAGLAGSAMSATQRKLLEELIDVYSDRLPEPLARLERSKIDPDTTHFAWAGEDKSRSRHYYRLHAKTFLVEYDNTQNEANHAHAVWRSPARDFGYDALRSHVQAEHS